MSVKIGFNNFKAFGPKMQTFSKKPITLIYGPNSIGKSSLLHSRLYLEYCQYKEGRDFDVEKTKFAGDELDFGGFKNFIHQHDTNNSIVFEKIASNKNDILRALGILKSYFDIERLDVSDDPFFYNVQDIPIKKIGILKDLRNENFFDSQISLDLIQQKLESDCLDSGIKFKYFVQYSVELYRNMMEIMISAGSDDSKDFKIVVNRSKYNLLKKRSKIISEAKSDLIQTALNNITDLSDKQFDDLFKDKANKLDEISDQLERAILVTSHTDVSEILSRLEFLKYLNSIQSVKTSFVVSENQTYVEIYIDDEKLFTFVPESNDVTINKDHKAIEQFQKMQKKYEPFEKKMNPMDEFSDIHFSFDNMIAYAFQQSKVQYYGPLRHYPERYEMFRIKKENLSNQNIDSWVDKFVMLNAIVLTKINQKIFGKKTLVKPLALYLLVISILGFIISSSYRQKMSEKDRDIALFNNFLPKKFKMTRKRKFTSIEVWDTLIQDKETREKINCWLGDAQKLKSNYRLHVNEKRINSRGVFVRRLHKLLGIEEKSAFFKQFEQKELHWEDKLENVIDYIWNGVDKLLCFKPKYEQQLIFTDISKNTEVTPRDMGLGISQALPILVSSFGSKNTNIYLEQPELHLHPAVQMELMDELIRSKSENDNSFFIESHSEHMLLRLMKRMRQTADGTLQDESLRLTPDDVCLLYVDNNGHTTYIKELELDYDGTLLDPWPNGFFEEGHRERWDDA